jgi:hypothetical protein
MEFAAMPRVEISEAAAPATSVVEKVRLFITMLCLLLWQGFLFHGRDYWQNFSATVTAAA